MIYVGLGPERGKAVFEEDALEYALERCGIVFARQDAPEKAEFQEMLVEWFYSGNWVKEEA